MEINLIVTSIFSASLLVALFVILQLFGRFYFQKRENRSFSILTDFPFEMVGENGSKGLLWTTILVGVFLSYGVFADLLLLIHASIFPGIVTLATFIGVVGILKAVSYFFLYRVPAYEFKKHFLFFGLSSLSSIMELVLIGFTFMNLSSISPRIGYTFMILSFVLGLLSALLIVNPRLSRWSQMETEMSEDGSVSTKRPRPFVLALSEWLLFLFNLFGVILFLLGLALLAFSL